MNPTPQDQKLETTPLEPQDKPDPQHEELKRLVLAHVREFGPRKYLAYYNQAKNLKESGVDPGAVRKSLVIGLPTLLPAPEGGVHFISKVHTAKQTAIYHVVRNAVEDALARRPPQFREEHASSG